MVSLGGSYTNLQSLLETDGGHLSDGGPLSFGLPRNKLSKKSFESEEDKRGGRFIIVANHLPVRASKDSESGAWSFEWDEDALISQAQEGLGKDLELLYVGCLPVDIPIGEQEAVSSELLTKFHCSVVFLDEDLKQKYYRGFCKQQLWPLFHYSLPFSPSSLGRFDSELWQAYVKANKAFADKLVQEVSMDQDYVWIHDYHLLVLPSLLRKRFHRVRCGLFLHSPFPSSEVFRTFPKRGEILRSLLNVDLIGFHTFDYARHFLSCCSRMLGVEHITSRGSIMLDFYGRYICVKIMPTGVNPERFLDAFSWSDTTWRLGELRSQFKGKTVLLGNDDLDVFKGIELKLAAVDRLLEYHREWRGKLVLIQITNAARSASKDLVELHDYIADMVQKINSKYGSPNYEPIVFLERPVPLYEKIALYAISDVCVVTATRDGMNLVPYEYIVCRQAVKDVESERKESMLVLSEFVGCSPSLSGAIRVNPWSIDDVADGLYTAIKMPLPERHARHDKHWRYVSHHTAAFWAQSCTADLQRFTADHAKMRCYGLGLGLDTFRMVALTENFRKLDASALRTAYQRATKRLFLLDYDGTLTQPSSHNSKPSVEVLAILKGLVQDSRNSVWIISGRGRSELGPWFQSLDKLGLAAEHGYFMKLTTGQDWEQQYTKGGSDFAWKEMVEPILEVYKDSTDGTYIESKESALVWHYQNADPDFGSWQAKELLDHLEGVLSNEPVNVSSGVGIVEVKPHGVSKGGAVERILLQTANDGVPPDFVLCIGDDRSDEDMFTAIEHVAFSPHHTAEVFACTVGQKPSKAPFYMNDTEEVAAVLARLAGGSANGSRSNSIGTRLPQEPFDELEEYSPAGSPDR
ncbi:hypothetical protein WJX84_012449 [Apatococcus fuscideae]|uniref:Uncharacterized protein n=1 Tax=Apatococcus fuscideae TaxID=2026836 RepID=A0AAW1SQ38_9CHLO